MSPASFKSTWENLKRKFKSAPPPARPSRKEVEPRKLEDPPSMPAESSEPAPAKDHTPNASPSIGRVQNNKSNLQDADLSQPLPAGATDESGLVRKLSTKGSTAAAKSRAGPVGYIPQEDEELAAQHNDFIQSLGVSDLYPREVPCRLVLFLNKEPVNFFEDFQIIWQRRYSSRFRQIEKGAKRFLSDKYSISQANLYRIAGNCRLLRIDQSEGGPREIAVDSRILEHERQWSTVLQQMVGGFFSKDSNWGKKCKLELRWEYSSLVIHRIEGKSYAKEVRKAVREKMVENWRKQRFLPRGDFKYIFNDSVVGALLEDDESLKSYSPYRTELSSQGKEFSLNDFKKEVIINGTRLLAVCVYSAWPLECLHRLMSHGIKNSDLPLKTSDFPEGLHTLKNMDLIKCDAFLNDQGSFIPHSFTRPKGPPVYEQIDDNVVIPVIFDDSESARLGQGFFGEVFAATIYPGHHEFSANRDEQFAIKRWKWWDSDAETVFKKEEEPLQKLHNAKCGNVVLHLTSWSQGTGSGRRFYMLFPLADCNLAQYLKNPSPAQDKEHVSWLFRQLFELADAVDQIHILAPIDPDLPVSDGLKPPQPRQTGGFHHDLKPPNILAFTDPETGRPVFKITDFGTAKLDFVLASKSRSHATYETQHFAGDPIYGAPDYSQHKRAGRKADIWSLGCCFLEILLWNFGYGGDKLKSFYFERFKEPAGNSGASASFWYFDVTNNTVALKPAVKQKLEELQRICYGRGQFQILVREIELMLTLKPNERKSAATVRSAFKAMHQEVEVNLDQDPDFYKKVQATTTAMFAPVTESFIASSRLDSIDNRMVAAPYGRPSFPLPVSMSDHQRSFSDSSSVPQLSLHIGPHLSDTAQSGAHLMTPNGDQLPSGGRPMTPSIEVSDYSAIGARGLAIIGGLYGTPTRDEIPTLRRKGSGSSNSATM